MRRTGALVLTALAGAALLAAPGRPAQAQRGRGLGLGNNRDRVVTPESLAPGEYSLDFDRILDAINRGEGRQALAYFERAAAEAEQQGDRRRAGRVNASIAFVTIRLGVYQKTIQSATRAIELLKADGANADDQVGVLGTAYSCLGGASRLVGDLPRARAVYLEGLAYAESQRGRRGADFVTGYLQYHLSHVALDQGNYQEALTRATEAAQIFDGGAARLPSGAPDRVRQNWHRQAASSGVALGRAERALGRPDAAEAALDRALKHASLVGLREVEVDIRLEQGVLALSRQDWSKAVDYYQRGLPLARQIGRGSALIGMNAGLARALGGLGRADEALAAAREAVGQIETQRGELGESALRSGFFESKEAIYQYAVRLALQTQHPDEAFALAERSRARAFLDLLGSQTTLSKGKTRALVAEEVQLRARLAEAQALSRDQEGGETSAAARAASAAAERDYRAFLERVRKESLEQASLMSVEPVTLAEIQNLLPEGTTLLEYLVGGNDVVLWVVDRARAKVVRIPGDRPGLVGEVRQFRSAISSQAPLAQVQAHADRLYHRLLEAARPEIRGARLVIVPHDVLHYLPFGALRAPDGRWLVEDFALATLPSASVLRYLADKSAGATDRALVVGNPDLGPALALPWAEREARMVGQKEAAATVLVRADATEAEAKKLLAGAGLLHFATHGELNEADPLSSALLLVPGGGEDGRLEVRELFGLDLHARLVFLSACETGLGKLSRGDELVGLQRAFLYAGTPAVITTLWKVEDRASFELVRAFYGHLPNDGPAEALRQAQVETSRTFPHPFAWAAFSFTGIPQ